MSDEKITIYPYREPKKFPEKSLHGRVRSANLPYEDPKRVRGFYYNVFGWDMFKLPQNVLGRNPAEETPDICCACGPAGASWECIVPGYLSVVLIHKEPGYEKPYVMMEVDMRVPLKETLERVVEKGGKILSGSDNSGDWAEVAMVEDPAGNRLLLWKCPDSRTWEEPETDYDRDVDPPLPDPDWDPDNLEWHFPKRFPAHTRNGRLRRFVMEYDNLPEIKEFYQDVFGWDIINTESASPDRPLMYCATGPGNSNWEPRVVSFAYGFLKPRETESTGTHPMYILEVDNIDQTVKKAEEFGGKLIKPKYVVDGNTYAVIQDTEGNGMYLWET